MQIRGVLLIIAIVCFVLAAVDVSLGDLDLVPLGLAALAGSHLVGDRVLDRGRGRVLR